ncbi:MAG: diphosphomevalonate decarboxylase [Candidatus Thermoplasmatota archaeon]|jgi:mevalonate-3-kinase|nr:diphosphomevalonate decarboxylase [Candidatus Thermoplasmatota archaeon]MCL5793922.1 diphosphomevalonate decarboxylase [Candidatus Thermoplasmatota archaeon]
MGSDADTVRRSVAFPTIGIILLGGISDKKFRTPRHNSAGIAYTGLDTSIHVATSVYFSREEKGTINGEPVDTAADRSPFILLRNYRKSIGTPEGMQIAFDSSNTGVLSGSSDAAAASFGKCIMDFSGGKVLPHEIEPDLRLISESAGRSLHGGLTLTEVNNGSAVTRSLLPESAFEGYTIVGCRFHSTRNPSDTIHENVVKNPAYPARIESTRRKSAVLKSLCDSRDIEGIFDLAQEDTDEYHRLLVASGVTVITPAMARFVEFLRKEKKESWLSYIITGGSNVFVATRRADTARISEVAEKYAFSPSMLKVAGPPESVHQV